MVLQGGEEEGSDETLPDPASLRAETRGLFAVPWERVIADEATYMKNPASLNFAVVKMLKASARVFLTATPTPNARIEELNALLTGLGCTLQIKGRHLRLLP